MKRVLALGSAALCLAAASSPACGAQRRLFSYDAADGATRAAAGALTLEFDQHLFSTHLLVIRATEGQATAELKSESERHLGPGGLDGAVGGRASGRDLYRIEPAKEGREMIDALCPGDDEGWLLVGRLRANKDLNMLVLGRKNGGRAHLCRRLAFTFHGEWRLPAGSGVDPRTIVQPHFPY